MIFCLPIYHKLLRTLITLKPYSLLPATMNIIHARHLKPTVTAVPPPVVTSVDGLHAPRPVVVVQGVGALDPPAVPVPGAGQAGFWRPFVLVVRVQVEVALLHVAPFHDQVVNLV